MNLFCLANTGQCVLYKILDERHVASLLEYTLFRNLMIMGISLILVMCQGRNPITAGLEMEGWEKKLLLFRAILGWLITFAINACLTMIPFTLLVILFQTSPFWTSIMGYKYNNEPLYKVEIIGMILCFIAVVAITLDEKEEGDQIMSTQTGKTDTWDLEKIVSKESNLIKMGGIALILIASVMSSGIAVLNRSLKQTPYSIVLFYHSFFGMLATLTILAVWCLSTDRPVYFLALARYDFMLLVGAAFLDAIGVLAQTVAFQSGNGSFVSLISFVNIIYAMLSDIFIFKQKVSATQITCASAILAICIGIGFEKIRLNNIKQKVLEVAQVRKH